MYLCQYQCLCLEDLVGVPSPNLRTAMHAEHCMSADSLDEFTTKNYGITTTPEIEWHAVVDPDAGLRTLKRTAYPAETFGIKHEDHKRAARLAPLAQWREPLAQKNRELEELSQPTLIEEELLAGRLYTGPMVRAMAPPTFLRNFTEP